MVRLLHDSCEILVIGGGLAGLSAARHAARLGRGVSLLECAGMFGGQVATVGQVEGLALPGAFSGQDLAVHLLEECRKLAVDVIETRIAQLEIGDRLGVRDEGGRTWHPKTLVVASGASLRDLGVPGEGRLVGHGVSHCATCDGGFFRDRDVVVVGGGDSAVQEALTLARTCGSVTMVCRGPLRAKRASIERLASLGNVRFRWGEVVAEILGEVEVRGVRLRNPGTGDEAELDCAGVFPFIGVRPNSDFLPPSLRDEAGFVVTHAELRTQDERIFAAGAVRAGYGGDINQAMAEGISAAATASRHLQ